MRYKLTLSYNGTDFSGWAKQPGKRTVQEELETALAKVLPGGHISADELRKVQTIVAGRTDAGVHARGQVVHFDWAGLSRTSRASLRGDGARDADSTNGSRTAEDGDETRSDFLRKLNMTLPEDIRAFKIETVPEDFSARFWAIGRTYKYRIADELSKCDPIRRDDIVWVKTKLDVKRMNRAIKGFTGLHNFSAFVKPRTGQTAIRDLKVFKFRRVLFGRDRGLVVATLKADAFAYNMVRSLVGAAIMVGDSRREVRWMKECLESRERQGATGPFAAKGLTFEEVHYPRNSERARARASQIKARRE